MLRQSSSRQIQRNYNMIAILGWALVTLTLHLASATSVQAQGVQCEQPNALIILDRSGSMNNENKWPTAIDAIDDLTLAFDAAVRFGLTYFPSSGECGTPNGVLEEVAPNNGANIRSSLNNLGNPNNNSGTPIAGALVEGIEYLRRLNDNTRKNVIILITDGDQTCHQAGNPIQRSAEAFQAGYEVYVISFGRGVLRPDVLTEMARAGGTNDYKQADNAGQLLDALVDIIIDTTAEVCDGKDNDCDGYIDNDIPAQVCETDCGRGQMICVDGQLSACVGGEIPEDLCDGIDNDCDSRTDEAGYGECITESGNMGTAMCLEGGILAEECIPDDPNREEICDGRDNNENEQVDENTDVPCERECHTGYRRCIEGILHDCSAPPVGGEVCNGYDDDCDGRIDEVMGICAGEETCVAGECLRPCTNNECFGDFSCNTELNLCERNPCPTPCAEGQRCVNRVCITPCLDDNQCSDEEYCDSSQLLCVFGRPSTTVEPMPGGMSAGEIAGAEAGGEAPAGFIVSPPPEMAGGQDEVLETASSCQSAHHLPSAFSLLFLSLLFIKIRERHTSQAHR